MGHKQGGKITKSHTTTSDIATMVVDFLQRSKKVNKISIGFLKNGAGSNGGTQSVKIIDLETCVRLLVTKNSSIQEIRFYTTSQDRQEAKLALARFVRNNGWQLRFGKTPSG